MDAEYKQADLFMRQLLLQRYKLLLEKVKEVYGCDASKMEALESTILSIAWLTN